MILKENSPMSPPPFPSKVVESTKLIFIFLFKMQNHKMRINFFPFQKSDRTFRGVESIIKNAANISSTTGLRF